MITKSFVLLALLLISCSVQNTNLKELFINYGVAHEGNQLYKYFHNLTDGFYVDIGSYDSIYASNTLNLYTMGWQGINIDASPDRLPRFFQLRKGQTNLNYAIGSENEIVSLFELTQDSSSTVSSKVKDYLKNSKTVVKQVKVPSISLKSLCQRFFYRKPIFMNLDIEGFGSKALESNDWNNTLCVPQLIFSEINQETHESGLPLPETILTKNGYKKQPFNVGLNEIYIHSSVQEKYKKNYQEGTKLLSEKQVFQIYSIVSSVEDLLKTRTSLTPHYQPKTDNVYYHFNQANEAVDLLKVNQFSNQISDKKNRPIVILNFSPSTSFLILPNPNYSSETVVSGDQEYTHVKAKKNDGSEIHAYILDHKEKNSSKPKILITNTFKQTVPTISNANVSSYDFQGLYGEIKNLDLVVRQSTGSLNSIKNQIKSSFEQTQKRLSKGKEVIKSFQNFDKKQVKSQDNDSNEKQKSFAFSISKISRSQVLLFILTFIVFFTTILIIFLSTEEAKENRKLAEAYNQQMEQQNSVEVPQMSQVSQVLENEQQVQP